jgi:hypothetical protein
VTLDSTSAFEVQAYLVETSEYAIATSIDGGVGVTWNPGAGGSHQGFPHTYGHQQWFMLPSPLAKLVLAGAALFDNQSNASQNQLSRTGNETWTIATPSTATNSEN